MLSVRIEAPIERKSPHDAGFFAIIAAFSGGHPFPEEHCVVQTISKMPICIYPK
jgi:hypothetical protein